MRFPLLAWGPGGRAVGSAVRLARRAGALLRFVGEALGRPGSASAGPLFVLRKKRILVLPVPSDT